MSIVSRRTFVKTAAACAAMLETRQLFANALGLPVGLQLYSVRDFLPKDYAGTLNQLGAMGYQDVEAAGFFNHSPADVKQAMNAAGLRCVSAHYPMNQLKPQLDQIIQFGQELGLRFVICASPMMKDPSRAKGLGWAQAIEAMSLDDWKWNADQLNEMAKQTQAAGIQLGYHNHFLEFHQKANGVRPYDVLLESTDPQLVTMEMDCGWVVIGGAKP
jgi:sugar phosphate isomerase/epimerase